MQTFLLTPTQVTLVIEALAKAGRYSSQDVSQLEELQSSENDGAYIILHQDGGWQWRTVGCEACFDVYDSTWISGPLTSPERTALDAVLVMAYLIQGSLNPLDIALSKA